METYLQVFSGGFSKRIVDLEKLIEKIKLINDQIKVTGVIAGWSADKEFYKELKAFLKEQDILLYFWLPVFSELDHYKEFQNVIDYNNNEIVSTGFQEGENFNFYCPNDEKNIENIKSIFLENFSDYDIDGVFLDKIRYPSFSNGINSIFTCFCDTCVKKMEESDINVIELKNEIKNILDNSENNNLNPLGIKEYKNFKFEFENPEINGFFEFKEKSINNTLIHLTDFFRKHNLKVGYDLFAPHISYFTGQNILSLSNHADFVKPMYYRRTYAPAGIPFEIKSYSQSFTKQKYFEITEKFFKIIGQNVKNQENISDEYMEQELICLKSNFGIKNICAGLEFNQIENIAPTNKVYLKHSLKSFYNAKIDGIVLSWDLMSIPYEHLTAYIESRQQNESKNSDSGGGCK